MGMTGWTPTGLLLAFTEFLSIFRSLRSNALIFLETPLQSFASWFGSQPAPLLGMDIGSSGIRLAELGLGRDGQLALEHCAFEPIDRDWIVDGNIEKFDPVADALRRVVKRSGTRTRLAAMALPTSAVITRKIILPAGLPDAELEAQVEIEANQYIPFSLDEVSLDFCVVGPAPSGAGEVEVLIAASRREKVQDRQGLAEAAGLKPVIVDVESFAARMAASRLVEALPLGHPDALVALFEIGDLATSLQVLNGAEVVYERDQPFGSFQLVQHIVRQYGLAADEAEQRLRSGELPEDFDTQVQRPFVDGLAQDLARALQFFFTSTPHNKVDHLLLAGAAAALPGLTAAVSSHSSFPSSVADPFQGMQIATTVRERRLQREAPGYLVACGLAMRRFAR